MPHSTDQEVRDLVRLASNVTDAFTAALFLVDEPGRDRLTLACCQSLSGSVVPGAVIRMGHGLVGWVAKHERPTLAKNFRYDTTTLQFYSKNEDIKSFAAAPVFDGDRLIGVFAVDSKQQYVFTDKKIKLLNEFAQMFARVIVAGRKRARLSAEVMDAAPLAGMAESFAACAGFDEVARLLRLKAPSVIAHDHLEFAVRSPDDGSFRLARVTGAGLEFGAEPLPLTHYRLGWVISQSRAILAPQLDAPVVPGDNLRWRSFIGAPVIIRNEVVAALGLMARRQGAFRPADVKTLTILAGLCASPLAELYHERLRRGLTGRDPLTGARDLRALLDAAWKPEPAGFVAAVNLKGFARVNYELGFQGGDSVLREMAERLGGALKDRGEVCRLHADTFAIAGRVENRAEASALINRILALLDGTPFHFRGVEASLVPAIGAACYPDDGAALEELLLKAQNALAHAKSQPGAVALFHGEQGGAAPAHLRSLK